MSAWEPSIGESDEWYTPAYVFDALGCRFDLDVAAPLMPTKVPADRFYTKEDDGLSSPWHDVSMFLLEGDVLWPCSSDALDVIGYCPPTTFISGPAMIARLGSPLGAGHVSAINRSAVTVGESSNRGLDDQLVQKSKSAAFARANFHQTKSTFLLNQLQPTGSPLDADPVIVKSREKGCAGNEQLSQKKSNLPRPPMFEVKPVGSGSAKEAASITLFGGLGSEGSHSSGVMKTGMLSSEFSRTDADIAVEMALSIRTISSHWPILSVPELFGAISFQPVEPATWRKEAGILIPGLSARLDSAKSENGLRCIGIVASLFTWANPPFGGRNALDAWLAKFFDHGNGLALTPDRTSAPWFRFAWSKADLVLLMPKVSFHRPDWSVGAAPGTGTAIWAAGGRAMEAVMRASSGGYGILASPLNRHEATKVRTFKQRQREMLEPTP